MSEDKKNRRSVITKKVEELIPTKAYQNVTISHQITEEIEWSSSEEREKKMTALNNVVLKEYSNIKKQVFAELEIGHVPASVGGA